MDKQQFKPKITCFYCINALNGEAEASLSGNGTADIHFVKLACSSMINDIYFLRAFESGADGLIVLVCPSQACRYVKGSIRAGKRVKWLRGLLDEIGLNGDRLFFHNTPFSATESPKRVIHDIVNKIIELGPSPVS
jgi:coenzyme F420-reducing hydrogenase delta subunit